DERSGTGHFEPEQQHDGNDPDSREPIGHPAGFGIAQPDAQNPDRTRDQTTQQRPGHRPGRPLLGGFDHRRIHGLRPTSLARFPPTVVPSGTSRMTTAPAPTMQSRPTPAITIAPSPIHVPSPTLTQP